MKLGQKPWGLNFLNAVILAKKWKINYKKTFFEFLQKNQKSNYEK